MFSRFGVCMTRLWGHQSPWDGTKNRFWQKADKLLSLLVVLYVANQRNLYILSIVVYWY